jgi:signal transduction histidine kinase
MSDDRDDEHGKRSGDAGDRGNGSERGDRGETSDRDRDGGWLDRNHEREAAQLAREAERLARDAERDAERLARDAEREAERLARDADRAAVRSERRGEPGGEPDEDDPLSFMHHWEQQQDKQRQRFERAWRRHAEHRERWEERRARHRARWERRHRRWKELHDEREMWTRMGDKGAWGPWWLQARMRRRIFSWLAFSFACGAVGMYFLPELRWWHAVVAGVVLSGVSGAIAFRLTRPLLMIVRVAQDIGDGKLDTRLDVKSHRGETRLLAVAINEMAERIEQQIKDQRQLLAAVSHELRTPLGHMRVLIDTARHGGGQALGELEREVLMLDDLVGRLLASSRLEFGNLDCRPTDLGELVSDVATAAGVVPEAIEAIGDVRATVDPTLVRRAVANLLDNARIHGGGAVAVRIERRARQVAIEVDDAGPGLPADRRADAFRAFVPSRGGGLGLGLALVSRIAVAHNGGAWITDRPGGGARVGFTVELAPRPAD